MAAFLPRLLRRPSAAAALCQGLAPRAAARATLKYRGFCAAPQAASPQADPASEPVVPPEPSIKVTPIPGKGLGVVATKPIKVGELLLAEQPILSYNAAFDPPFFREVLENKLSMLSAEEKAQCMDLHDAHESNEHPKSITGIVLSNAFMRETEHVDAALCLTGSRLNHSCVPNVEQTWDPERNEVQVFASRDIQEGEELCNYYMDLLAPREKRQKELQSRYNFECKCPACQLTGEELEFSDVRRTRLRALLDDIEGLYKLKMEGHPRERVKPQRGLERATSFMKVLEEEKLNLPSYEKNACNMAAELAKLNSTNHTANRWFKRALEAARKCHLPTHQDVFMLEHKLYETEIIKTGVNPYQGWTTNQVMLVLCVIGLAIACYTYE